MLTAILLLLMIFASCSNTAGQVYASEIIIVVPHTTPTPDNNENREVTKSNGQELFPVAVTESYDEHGRSTIAKRYELSRAERPENIPREDFSFGTKTYSLTDIIKATNQFVDTKEVSEVVEKSSPTNNLEKVLALLDKEIPYDDGQFIGSLSLDADSIKIEVAGRQASHRNATISREYPNLSNQDISLIPKTVSDNGTTYTLTDVNWQTGNTTAVDYTPIGDYYTANSTYSASISTTSITGYKVTASYSGTVAFTNSDIIVYEAVFMEIRNPAQILQPVQSPVTEEREKPNNANNEEVQFTSTELPQIQEISIEELLVLLNDGDAEENNDSEESTINENPSTIILWLGVSLILFLVLFFFRKPIKFIAKYFKKFTKTT